MVNLRFLTGVVDKQVEVLLNCDEIHNVSRLDGWIKGKTTQLIILNLPNHFCLVNTALQKPVTRSPRSSIV